ncbi:MAG: LysR family transcriptional regulator [Phycisphaeraceae bacterium]|nr:MAG: LysR family transcriptional regulator [Phycisphaeraceae bacterium]
MELTPMRYFLAIARTGHLTRAAREVGVTQPALSAMLRKLERELGSALVERTGRGVSLTESGRAFLRHAEDAVRAGERAARAVREIAGLEAGSIRVGGGATAVAYLLPPAVSRVRRAHPGLRFYVREAGSSAVASAVASGELDMGIVTLPVIAPGAEDLVKAPLVEDELRMIVPEGHRLAGRASFRWADLVGEDVVAFEAGTAVRQMIDRGAASAGVSLNVVMEVRSIESITSMVGAGIGVGFVSRFALAPADAAGGRGTGAAGLSCRDGRLTRRLAVVRRRDRAPSPAAAMFEGVLRERGRSIHKQD